MIRSPTAVESKISRLEAMSASSSSISTPPAARSKVGGNDHPRPRKSPWSAAGGVESASVISSTDQDGRCTGWEHDPAASGGVGDPGNGLAANKHGARTFDDGI